MLAVGIDWSEEFHLVALGRPGEGVFEVRRVEHSPKAVDALVERIAQLEPDPAEVRVVLEARHGLLVERLLEAGYTVVPVNPRRTAALPAPPARAAAFVSALASCGAAVDEAAACPRARRARCHAASKAADRRGRRCRLREPRLRRAARAGEPDLAPAPRRRPLRAGAAADGQAGPAAQQGGAARGARADRRPGGGLAGKRDQPLRPPRAGRAEEPALPLVLRLRRPAGAGRARARARGGRLRVRARLHRPSGRRGRTARALRQPLGDRGRLRGGKRARRRRRGAEPHPARGRAHRPLRLPLPLPGGRLVRPPRPRPRRRRRAPRSRPLVPDKASPLGRLHAVGERSAQVMLAKVGPDMGRFSSHRH